jgi:nitrate reductase delta subunit
MKTYKVLGALLDYPGEALVAAAPELEAALEEERLLSDGARLRLAKLLDELCGTDLYALQERYVDLFDRVRSLSLHLFEHVHGESRDRGQALVDLRQLYTQHGFALDTSELPDFLPAFLEFLSRIAPDEAAALLDDVSHIVDRIGARLAKRGSAYAAVFDALAELSGHTLDAGSVTDEEIRKEDDPAALDAAWEEQPAFGPSKACGGAQQPGVSVIQFHKGVAA